MKYLMILTVGICLLTVPAMAQSAADEAAVRDATKQYFTAHNKHDAKAVGALLDEKFQNWTGERKNRADTVKYLEDRFARMKVVQINLDEDIGVDFTTPDIAIHKFYSKSTGFLQADGTSRPMRGLYGFLYVRKSGQWLRRSAFWRSEE